MMLTPDEITKKTFTVRHVRGYDPGEVDDFLDRIVADYANALQQLNAAQANSARYSAATQQIPIVPPVAVPVLTKSESDPIGNVARLLTLAQQAADQQAAEAKVEAAAQIANAQAAGDKVIADANAQAAQIVADGNSKRNEIVGELEMKRSELQSKVDALAATHADAVAKLTSALNSLGAVNG